ncbi:MAG: hypothetical protein COA79_18145 [Planctomycetota bacterium]|nr:MAG: hypothetical protein COA79_18145 [Planctomycetota bacterium]
MECQLAFCNVPLTEGEADSVDYNYTNPTEIPKVEGEICYFRDIVERRVVSKDSIKTIVQLLYKCGKVSPK